MNKINIKINNKIINLIFLILIIIIFIFLIYYSNNKIKNYKSTVIEDYKKLAQLENEEKVFQKFCFYLHPKLHRNTFELILNHYDLCRVLLSFQAFLYYEVYTIDISDIQVEILLFLFI